MIRDNANLRSDDGLLKIHFRLKPKSRNSFRVETTVRVNGRPKSLHFCYLSGEAELGETEKLKIHAGAREKWGIVFSSQEVAIDWTDAEAKWAKRFEPKSRPDRDKALRQLYYWISTNSDGLLDGFQDAPAGPEMEEGKQFYEEFCQLSRNLATRLRTNQVDVHDWWEQRESPRLLLRFYEFTKKHCSTTDVSLDASGATDRPKFGFSRQSFLKYLKGNIINGWARNQYRRECQQHVVSNLNATLLVDDVVLG